MRPRARLRSTSAASSTSARIRRPLPLRPAHARNDRRRLPPAGADCIYPNAKRVLLTAYADTEAAIRAINSAKIHYYLNKPWDPPEEKLYPVLDDLLETWKQGYKAPFEGIRVVGVRWSSTDHAVRDFLSRNRIPYQWMNPEQHPEAVALLKEKGIDDAKLPVVLFGDGTALVQPTYDRTGRQGRPAHPGPAGVLRRRRRRRWAGRPGRRRLRRLGRPADAGGRSRAAPAAGRLQLEDRELPRLPRGLSGEELAKRAFLQANRLGAEFLTQRSPASGRENQYHILACRTGTRSPATSACSPPASRYCKLDVPGADTAERRRRLLWRGA